MKEKEKMPNYPQAKKSLGQHFLTDTHILGKIVCAGNVSREDTVLEIGPGRGALTRALLDTGARVIAVEKDENLAALLRETFKEYCADAHLTIIEGDILDVREILEKELRGVTPKETAVTSYKVVANIPYYITGKILRFLFSLETLPASIVLLIQDEVARRITVEEGKKESVLSLSIKAFGTPSYKGKIKAGSFSPAPKVDSAILLIEHISRNYFDQYTEEQFFNVIKKAFSQKRKTLQNTLFQDNKEKGVHILTSLGLTPTVRPEELALDSWKKLIIKMDYDNQ